MESGSLTALTWVGIAVCVSQSAFFSGLNLALFGVSRLRLEVESSTGNEAAERVLRLRQDSNFILTTVLWGNVGINVLVTLLAESVLLGVSAFFFSTIVITFLGEIVPQAYCSRNALTVAAFMSPVLRCYQVVLYPVAKPTAKLLDWWLGPEGVHYYRERDFRKVIQKHIDADTAELDRIEGLGALNFLALDDVPASEEGAWVDPQSVISLASDDGVPRFPHFQSSCADPFLRRVQDSGKRWIVVTDPDDAPLLVLNAPAFLQAALFDHGSADPKHFCHRPIIVFEEHTLLGKILPHLRMSERRPGEDVIDHDVILIWGARKRIITGSDILGRLMRGIALQEGAVQPSANENAGGYFSVTFSVTGAMKPDGLTASTK